MQNQHRHRNSYLLDPAKSRRTATAGAVYGHFCQLHRIRTSSDQLLYVIATASGI
ncbi:hypothetical protein [Siphonobacter aquaeclarae]|jgi:hypothetical protein|uniref:Uncharacterized protein n=1 Tax=Siphonobacter aquaeclarae TaxID=563176 RepID=A0A1G9X737_9BACT|nr:hypothetical protein [Siphonobacter aquaeclarae]MBO9638072.1 hypothetical protein [Siphonobacter aquaeclarae]SDM92145.1 hypothetical protein SAMN04488090_4568 [Siphonobacter aquaeclarae]